MAQARIARQVVITGRVQGVSYRAWCAAEAERWGVAGWVGNRADGSVAALFAGAPDAVAAMLEACRKGPPAAQVRTVEAEPVTPVPDIRQFRIAG
jgi:acylphosphatase